MWNFGESLRLVQVAAVCSYLTAHSSLECNHKTGSSYGHEYPENCLVSKLRWWTYSANQTVQCRSSWNCHRMDRLSNLIVLETSPCRRLCNGSLWPWRKVQRKRAGANLGHGKMGQVVRGPVSLRRSTAYWMRWDMKLKICHWQTPSHQPEHHPCWSSAGHLET